MIIVLEPGLADENLRQCSALAARLCLDCRILDQPVDGGRRILQILDKSRGPDPDLVAQMKLWPGVEHVLDFESHEPLVLTASPVVQLKPRWAAAQEWWESGRPGCSFSATTFVWIAGPCAVENPEYLGEIGRAGSRQGRSFRFDDGFSRVDDLGEVVLPSGFSRYVSVPSSFHRRLWARSNEHPTSVG